MPKHQAKPGTRPHGSPGYTGQHHTATRPRKAIVVAAITAGTILVGASAVAAQNLVDVSDLTPAVFGVEAR
jgi:hypothetical protein